jgi:tetratricopeptide (TPR) repeat protein
MSLSGELEDLPLVDIVQVVAQTQRTGRLRIDAGPGQDASIEFRDGLIVSARSWKTAPLASQTLPHTLEEREVIVRGRVREALRLLLELKAGRFDFSAAEEPAAESRHRFEELREGLSAQGAVLDLLRERDEGAVGRKPEASALVPARVDLGDERMIAEFKRRLEAVLIADPASRYAVGIAYKGMGLLDDAIRELERATRDPRHVFPGSSMLGMCHLENGDATEAVRWLEKGLALPGRSDHEYQSVRILLALAYSAAGRLKEALELYQQFLRHGMLLDDLSGTGRQESAQQKVGQVLPFSRTGARR